MSEPGAILTPAQVKARKRRNLWIALSIAAFVVLVFLITMVKVEDSIVAGAS
jgi:cytochrome c-type biogenesis protein CcmE